MASQNFIFIPILLSNCPTVDCLTNKKIFTFYSIHSPFLLCLLFRQQVNKYKQKEKKKCFGWEFRKQVIKQQFDEVWGKNKKFGKIVNIININSIQPISSWYLLTPCRLSYLSLSFNSNIDIDIAEINLILFIFHFVFFYSFLFISVRCMMEF